MNPTEPRGALSVALETLKMPGLVLGLCLLVLSLSYAHIYKPFGEAVIPNVQLRFNLFPVILAAYFVAVWAAVRSAGAPRSRAAFVIVLLGAVVLRVIPLAGSVPGNADLGRHLWEGRVLLEGLNPYAGAPEAAIYDPLRERLAAEGDNLHSGRWLQYEGVRSTYGPVATALFALPHLLPWDRIMTLRVMMTGFDLLTVLLLLGVARALERPPLSVVIYAWSPVCINGFADRGQVDVAMTFLLALALLLVLRRRPAWGGVAFAASALVKVSPLLLLLPLLRVGGLPLAAGFAVAVVAGLAPFAGAGVSGLAGLGAFAHRWRRNDSVYSVVLWLVQPLRGVVDPRLLSRGLVAVAALAYAAVSSARLREDDRRGLVAAMANISAAVILLSPVTYPWYAAPLLAFVCFTPRAPLLALSVAPMFWYLRFLKPSDSRFWNMLVEANEHWRQPWRVPVYAVVAGLFLRESLACGRQGRDSSAATPPPDESPPHP